MRRILVINPNSNERVTRGLARSLAPLAIPGKLEIECRTLRDGPFGIETEADIASVVEPLKHAISVQLDNDAYVIACYSDPGLEACRGVTEKPVLGMQLCALTLARALNKRFGVLALGRESVRRHVAYIDALGLTAHLAAEKPLGISVSDSIDGDDTFARLLEAGEFLVRTAHAEALILGCAGLAAHQPELERALGVTVIDPARAAVGCGAGLILP